MRLMKRAVHVWLCFVASGPAPLFLPAQAAGGVLQRTKRANTGLFEEVLEGNLERECLEEKCDLEEVREVFEDDEKTVRIHSVVLQSDVIWVWWLRASPHFRWRSGWDTLVRPFISSHNATSPCRALFKSVPNSLRWEPVRLKPMSESGIVQGPPGLLHVLMSTRLCRRQLWDR